MRTLPGLLMFALIAGCSSQQQESEPGDDPVAGAAADGGGPAAAPDAGVADAGAGADVAPSDEPTSGAAVGDEPLPMSADPADLRAMKSAQEMLAAERRLRELRRSGDLDIGKVLTFEEVSSWPYEDGLKGMPETVKAQDGEEVLMLGFMLPIDEVENIKEFLLVQSLWACCYGQPPDINGIVRVVMKGDKRVDYQFDPIQVRGTFKVEETLEDGYCIDIFQLHADSVSLIE